MSFLFGKQKATSIFSQMEDDLNIFENRRWLLHLANRRRPQYFHNWKTTYKMLRKDDDLLFFRCVSISRTCCTNVDNPLQKWLCLIRSHLAPKHIQTIWDPRFYHFLHLWLRQLVNNYRLWWSTRFFAGPGPLLDAYASQGLVMSVTHSLTQSVRHL